MIAIDGFFEEAEAIESVEEAEEEAEEEASEREEEAEEETEAESSEAEAEEEEEVSLVEIAGRGKFYTTNQVNGDIYKIDADEEVGEQVGKFVSSIPVFF